MILIGKKPDSGVKLFYLNADKYVLSDTDETITIGTGPDQIVITTKKSYKKSKAYKQLQSEGLEVMTTADPIDKSDLESRKQLYHEGGVLKKDLTWEKRLMPDQLVKKKHLNFLEDSLKSHVAANDMAKAMAVMIEINDCRKEKAGGHNTSLFWANKALDGLARASVAKPDIEAKLKKIKAEL